MAEIKSHKPSFKFNVIRQPAELIRPAGYTPYEVKELSDLDNTPQLRFHVVTVLAYKNHHGGNTNKNCLHGTVHPAKIFKDAIAKALVSYYPFAGRVRAATGGRLVVECNGDGVLFIEADANVTLDEFGGDQFIYDPFYMTDLLHVVPGADGIIHAPLLVIQVTRLKCGGFIFAHRLNHAMADAAGVVQFFNAVAEFARGAESPSVTPIWERNLLTAQPLLEINIEKNFEIREIISNETVTRSLDMVSKYFFFGSAQMAAIRSSLPQSDNIKSSVLSSNDNNIRNISNLNNLFVISDVTKLGFNRLDFGWGKSGSVRHEGIYRGRHFISILAPFKYLNETGVLATIHLPRPAMDKFVKIVTQFSTVSNL